MFAPMRCGDLVSYGVLSAPVGSATVAFMHAVGVKTLMAWDPHATQAALDVYYAVRVWWAGGCGGPSAGGRGGVLYIQRVPDGPLGVEVQHMNLTPSPSSLLSLLDQIGGHSSPSSLLSPLDQIGGHSFTILTPIPPSLYLVHGTWYIYVTLTLTSLTPITL